MWHSQVNTSQVNNSPPIRLQLLHVRWIIRKNNQVCKHNYRVWKDGYTVESMPDPFGSPLPPLCTKCDDRFERKIPSCATIMEDSFEPGSPKDSEIIHRFLEGINTKQPRFTYEYSRCVLIV